MQNYYTLEHSVQLESVYQQCWGLHLYLYLSFLRKFLYLLSWFICAKTPDSTFIEVLLFSTNVPLKSIFSFWHTKQVFSYYRKDPFWFLLLELEFGLPLALVLDVLECLIFLKYLFQSACYICYTYYIYIYIHHIYILYIHIYTHI